VTNLSNGESVSVRVNDRGPARRLHRVVDLSRQAFSQIAELNEGLIPVEIVVVLETEKVPPLMTIEGTASFSLDRLRREAARYPDQDLLGRFSEVITEPAPLFGPDR
jgi:rare lipoprotein A